MDQLNDADPEKAPALPDRPRTLRDRAAAAWRHMRAIWPRWTLLPPLPFVLWAVVQACRGSLRWEHVAMAVTAIILAYTHPKTKRLMVGIYPVAIIGVIYDVMAVAKHTFHFVPATVHVCDVRAIEQRWFAIPTATGRVPLPDWFQAHTTPVLDFICAIPYAFFIYAVLGFGAYLYFKSYDAMRRLGWAFLITNLAGFITYQLYPAAPPWYVHRHGCVVDFSVLTSEGPGLARVDHMLGVHYFGSMYARAATVFGAVPSLHVAYPCLMAIAGYRVHKTLGRVLLIGWYFWMCFAAAYLDHHWVFDMVVGTTYALTASLVVFTASSRIQLARGGEHAMEPGR